VTAPAGYQVGDAWVQVLPSFDTWNKRMAAQMAGVRDVTVHVETEVSTKKAAETIAKMDERLSQTPITKRLELDERAFNAKMAVISAKRDALVLRIDADISALNARIADWERKRGSTKINVDAEIAKAQAKIAALTAQRTLVTVDFDVKSDKAEQDLTRLENQVNRISNNQHDINMEASDASRAISIIGGLTVALSVLGQVAPAAAAAVATVPTAVFAAAQGLGALLAGLSGIGEATKAMQAVDDEAATSATEASKKRIDAANRVAAAQSSLERALDQADRAAIQGARQVRDAREALADAQTSAARRVESAEESLASAHVSAQYAQEALTRAREDAIERLEDLRLALSGAALDEEAAVLAVVKARRRLEAAREAGMTGLGMTEIELEARQADQALAEVRERYGDLREEADETARAGVDGSRQVVAAQRDAEVAAKRIHDAERDLNQARADGAHQVAKAQERIAQAQQQAGWAAADASRAITDAQNAIAEASQAAGDIGSAALDKQRLAMLKLTPEGQRFALFLQNQMKPALQGIGAAAQETMLPKIEYAFDRLLTLAPMARQAFADTGDVIGDLAIKGAFMVTSGPWRADFQRIVARNNRVLYMMGDAGLSALDATRHLTIAAGPLAEALAASAQGLTAQFAAWLEKKRESGELQVWFAEMSVRVREFFETVGQITGGVWNFLQALAPLGRVILDIVGPFVQMIGALAEANPALTTMIALVVLAGSSFISFFRTVGGLTQAVSTSVGVYRKYRDSLLGTRDAVDATAAATDRSATATQAVGTAAERSGGLLGRLRGGLDSVRGAYTAGSTAASGFATATTTAVGSAATAMQTRLVPALQGPIRELDSFLPATTRAGQAMSTMATGAKNTLGTVAGAVGGTVAAVGRGVGGVVSGLVGALGGPFGLAITAATVGLGFLISSQAEAAQAAAEHKAQIQSLTDALVESGGAIDENVRKQIRLNLEQRSVNDNARNLGLNVGFMIRAIGEGGDAASSFERDLMGLSEQLTIGKGLAADDAEFLRGMATELMRTGGSASDFSGDLNALATDWQRQTGASDEARDAYHSQLIQFLDLVGGYTGAKGDFDTAEQEQKDIANAQNDAASETERHTRALKELQDQILGTIDKSLAYRQAQQSLAEAQDRVKTATADEMPAALLQLEQAMVNVITKAGDMAYAQSTAATEIGKVRDAQLAQIQAAVGLAAQYKGPLPEALQTYLSQLLLTKDETGRYLYLLDQVPLDLITKVIFDQEDAQKAMTDFIAFMTGQISASIGNFVANFGWGTERPRAWGGVDIPAYAMGGVRPMSARFAQIVPPNQPRLIGDRMRDAEGFIPINTEPRSISILADVAGRMGFGLVPMALGGLVGMQAGGVTQASGANAEVALSLNASNVDAFTAAVQELTTAGLVPLANEVEATTAPALVTLEEHTGVTAVDSATAMATAFTLAWQATTQTTQASVSAILGYLTALRAGIQQTGNVFASTSEWIGAAWGRVREYTAAPVRAALSGPYNAGLIPAWNYLNTFFNLGRPLAPIGIPFATGGPVPGVGNKDSVPAMLMPGEYVISKPVVKKWGLKNIDAAHMATRRGGFPGLEGMFTGDDSGIFRVGYASGGPVPEALARATAFGRSMHGKPYVWGGSSEAGTDCSGWMAMLARALADVKPYARREWATAATAGGSPPPRFTRGIDGLFAIGVNPGVHTAGTLAGTNVEAGGAHGHVAFGPPSTGADNSRFPLKFHMADLGGNFVSGGAGGSFDLAGFIRESFNATHEQLATFQEAWGANMMAQAGAAVVSQATDAAANWAVGNLSLTGVPGNVESWRPLVLQALRMLNLPLDWADITLRRMNQESGGNPRAVNLWDVNAQRGDPSKGLMQVIGSTFRAYRDTRAPDDVFDPLANLLSSMRYATARYGSLPAGYGRPGGYDDGGYLPPGYSTVYSGLRRPEAVLTDNQWSAMYSLATDGRTGGGEFRGQLYLSSGEFLGVVHGAIEQANDESGRVLARRTR
jgi:cell wall-associated NlpC family hydrolase